MPKPTRSPDDAFPCPAWCTRVHSARDHIEDRYHRGPVSVVPGVAGDGEPVDVLIYVASFGRTGPCLVVEESERPRRLTLALTTAVDVLAAAHSAVDFALGPPHGHRSGTNE